MLYVYHAASVSLDDASATLNDPGLSILSSLGTRYYLGLEEGYMKLTTLFENSPLQANHTVPVGAPYQPTKTARALPMMNHDLVEFRAERRDERQGDAMREHVACDIDVCVMWIIRPLLLRPGNDAKKGSPDMS